MVQAAEERWGARGGCFKSRTSSHPSAAAVPQGGVTERLAARALLAAARGYAALPPLAQRATGWPFKKLTGGALA